MHEDRSDLKQETIVEENKDKKAGSNKIDFLIKQKNEKETSYEQKVSEIKEEKNEEIKAGGETSEQGDSDIALEKEELSEVTELRRLLAEQVAQSEDYFNRLVRMQADFENFRRRARQEKEEMGKYASEQLLIALLPVLDNFERALAVRKESGGEGDFLTGIEMIYRQFQDILFREGLEVIPAKGEQFDPNKHEAVIQVEDDHYPENEIVEELRRGYCLKGKVIRPAMVKVARGSVVKSVEKEKGEVEC